eukprot:CAMPEP_0182429898 /NCGR_PEP_ID=MMETSP1167-20130531/34818_1 /TAXON_ID=2988 /ORGANISM="Mallomonas Sp, Strain CCMP3275" /LENGTH=434 /DNA_ID=CAMNT_0024614273 /DNA_START=107 /DNA_END=1411 /DNA_ORIENTATION=+
MSSEDVVAAINLFEKKFRTSPEISVFAPGRVNLIGEHVDYNMGFVLPFALPFRTVIVGAKSNDSVSRIVSSAINESAVPSEFVISKDLKKGEPDWLNYIKGTIYEYLPDLPSNCAFNAVIVSNVPIGSGLSSSAALEVATATFLERVFNLVVDPVTKARRCQRAEHNFAGTPCGIMDQYISAMGVKDNLLLIDCRTEQYELVPFGKNDKSPVLLITNSNVKHNLSGSEYPIRVKQCQTALTVLKQKTPSLKSLRDATMEMLEKVKRDVDEVVYRRAKHCITENERTLAVVTALKHGDYATAGQQMTCSHRSLQHDYEVSCPELDKLVELALAVPGVLGSRMTGGGFGGCTVTLVERCAVRRLETVLKEEYPKACGLQCECYEALPSEGAGELALITPKSSILAALTGNNWSVSVGAVAVVGLAVLMGVSVLSRK